LDHMAQFRSTPQREGRRCRAVLVHQVVIGFDPRPSARGDFPYSNVLIQREKDHVERGTARLERGSEGRHFCLQLFSLIFNELAEVRTA
jgi:hypothetical protein